jgi:hypothetical protein
VPHRGVAAGTAANLILHVAELMGRRDGRRSLAATRASQPDTVEAVTS